MFDWSSISAASGFEEARLALRSEVKTTFRRAATDPTARSVKVTVPLEQTDPLNWLRSQSNSTKVFWSGRGRHDLIAGIGEADVIAGPTELAKGFAGNRPFADSNVRYFGGARFDTSQTAAPEWSSFGAFRFVLPRFEIVENESGAFFGCNLVFPKDQDRLDEILADLDKLMPPLPTGERGIPDGHERRDLPNRSQWISSINALLKRFESGHVDKVVLARKSTFHFPSVVDPFETLASLRERAPDSFQFAISFSRDATFIGASPERLYRRQGRRFWSEAVAGTSRRGENAAEDAMLAHKLLNSEKDLREHAYVVRSIQNTMGPLCAESEIDESPHVMKAPAAHHLLARFSGTLNPRTSDADILLPLHPTPAVGGFPRATALSAIAELEPFDRGWYAGPVGWIGPDGAEFTVAIRSGLVYGNQVSLYSGAGIVAGSHPESEWDEIEQKISGLREILDDHPSSFAET